MLPGTTKNDLLALGRRIIAHKITTIDHNEDNKEDGMSEELKFEQNPHLHSMIAIIPMVYCQMHIDLYKENKKFNLILYLFCDFCFIA